MMNKTLGTIALAACCGLAFSACGGDDDEKTNSTPGSTGTDPTEPDGLPTDDGLAIEGFAFAFPAEVSAGSVGVVNNDPAQHTITDDAGSFDFSIDASASTSIELTAGTYEVRCTIHPTMTATLTVV